MKIAVISDIHANPLAFDKVMDFNMEEIKRFSTSSLITRNINDVGQVQNFIVMGMQVFIKAPIMAVWAISKIANKGFEFSLITAIGVLVVLTLIITLIKPSAQLSHHDFAIEGIKIFLITYPSSPWISCSLKPIEAISGLV